MGGFFGANVRGLGGFIGGGAAALTYADVLVDDYGADEVWPLVDIASGTTIHAHVNSNRDGTLTGWDLQNAAGPVTDTLAPYSDGTNDDGDVHTSNGSDGLVDIFDGATGAIFGWALVPSGGWTDGAYRAIVSFRVNEANRAEIYKHSTNGKFTFLYEANNVLKTRDVSGMSTNDWFSFCMTWDVTAGADGELKGFINGSQADTTATGLGTWAGALATANITSRDGSIIWDGYGAYIAVRFGSIWTPTQIQNMHDAAATAGADKSP